jgi:hypothetical protein
MLAPSARVCLDAAVFEPLRGGVVQPPREAGANPARSRRRNHVIPHVMKPLAQAGKAT